MSNLGLWGKNPCVTTLCVCHLSCLIQPLPTSLMLCWVVEQLWMLVVGTIINEVVLSMEDCQSLSHTHTPPMTVFTQSLSLATFHAPDSPLCLFISSRRGRCLFSLTHGLHLHGGGFVHPHAEPWLFIFTRRVLFTNRRETFVATFTRAGIWSVCSSSTCRGKLFTLTVVCPSVCISGAVPPHAQAESM